MPSNEPDNATTIHPTDVPKSERAKYRRFRSDNQPGQNGKWRDETVHIPKDREAVLDAIAGQLELTDYQIERAK